MKSELKLSSRLCARFKFSPLFSLAAVLPFSLWFSLSSESFATAQQQPYLHAPAVEEYARHDPKGVTILPEGRFLTPFGSCFPLAQWPHGLVLSPDEKTIFVASEGVGQLITDWDTPNPKIETLEPVEKAGKKRKSNAGGAAFTPDSKSLYWSGGESGKVFVFDVATKQKTAEIDLNVSLNGKDFEDSFAMDIKLSEDGKLLFCADVTNFRVAVVDTFQHKIVGSAEVGRYPYALAVSGNRVCVANIGMFAYSPVPSPPAGSKFDKRGLTYPPFAFPSREAEEGVEVEDRKIPGLGDPNVLESFSVWSVDVSDPTQPKTVQKIKTGLLVGAPADNGKTVGGSAPNFLSLQGNTLFVSNGNNDTIEKIELSSGKILRRTRLEPSPLVSKLRGAGPSGTVLSPDGTRLYIAESGLNAIAVMNASTGAILGHIPSAWYPYRLAISKDGKRLICINFRGFGSGPAGIKNLPDSKFLDMKGALEVLEIPKENELPALTQKVLANNGIVDRREDRRIMASPVIPTVPGKPSEQIKYVVFITKENHTYDAIFDHIKGANDDPSLLKWGYHQKISAAGQPTLEDVAVMTNHNALAKQFAVSDNFYMQPEASGVGHRWLVGVQPDNFCQMTYTLGWDFKLNSKAPGRRAAFGSNGSIAPEDYPEAGSMWEHLSRFGVPFRNYGEGFEFAGVGEDEDESKTGARETINMPMPKALFDNTCREFPIFNMNIPDQYRAHWFEKDFRKVTDNLTSKSPKLPKFINIAICNDHGAGPNAKKGYPYVASWMADNDLALGRIVDFLSHTPYWKNMAIFVTQDDSGGEADHVDRQRSVLLAISPWIRHGYVSHRHTTITSMHRTMYEIFGLPALNQFDALANDFSDCFTMKPDFTPYSAVSVDARIFDPEKAKDPKDPEYKLAAKLKSVMDDPEEMKKRNPGSVPVKK